MSLRDKLRRAFDVPAPVPAPGASPEVAAGPGAAPAPEPAVPALRERLLRHHERTGRYRRPATLPEGHEVENARGRFFLRRMTHAASELHGTVRLGAGRSAERSLFLDTETTGLAGGAGTVVFMTGLAYFTGETLVLEQAFMRSFAEEAAALQHVATRLLECERLVTFVGKCFDRHRLAARFSVQKVEAAILGTPHLDLYYVARKQHGARLPDVKLRTVEKALLGVEREDDLPGSEAPAAFLDWVRDRSGAIGRVFEHNRLDVLSLVTLCALLER